MTAEKDFFTMIFIMQGGVSGIAGGGEGGEIDRQGRKDLGQAAGLEGQGVLPNRRI
jgi:hypothetical protein